MNVYITHYTHTRIRKTQKERKRGPVLIETCPRRSAAANKTAEINLSKRQIYGFIDTESPLNVLIKAPRSFSNGRGARWVSAAGRITLVLIQSVGGY